MVGLISNRVRKTEVTVSEDWIKGAKNGETKKRMIIDEAHLIMKPKKE